MLPISFSEMDIRNMKRKELQALCKNHKIPANLTNLEMANRLESLLKEKEKPIARGKSCIKSTGEEASEMNSDHAKRLSKKVRFSPENETFEFLASEIKPAERGRRERTRKRSMLRQVEGIQGIVTEDDVNKPVRETKSKVNKVANEVEHVVKTKGVKGSRKSVAFESVSMVETRVSTRSSKIQEGEKKEEAMDDGLSWKNQTKRTTRNRGMKMVNRASDFLENKGVVEDGVAVVEVVGRGRKQGQLVDDTNITGTSSKTECELEVVLEIEEPLKRSSRSGGRRQSVVPKTEKLSTVKDKTKNTTLVIGGTSFKDNAMPKRSSTRLKSVAVSDEVVAENVIKNKPGNRKRDLVLEEQKLLIIEGKRGNNILKRGGSPVEENATRKSSRRKSIVASDKNLAENVKKQKPTVGREMDMKSGEKEDPFNKASSVVEERPRKLKRNDVKVKKALVTDRTGEAVKSKMLSRISKEVHAQSLILEENIAVVESDSGRVMNSTGVLCDNLEDKDVFEEKNSPKVTGLVGKVSDSAKLQNYHEDTVSGISGLEVVLNINTEDEVTFQKKEDEADKDEVFQDHYSANEFEVEKNIVKAVDLAEDQPDCLGLGANQVENSDLEKEMELLEEGESETQSSGTLESQNDVKENREEIEIEDESGTNDLDSLKPEVESKEDHLTIDQPDCLDNPPDNLDLGIEFRKIEETNFEIQASGFDTVIDNYSQTERNEDDLVQEIKSNDDFNSNSFAVLESEVEQIQATGVVSPDATLENEGYPQSDQSVCLAKRDENIEIKELEMSETNGMGKHSDLKCTEEQHSLEAEVVLDHPYVETSTPGQEKGIDRHELGKLTDLRSGPSKNRVDVENSYVREEKHFVELEDIYDNSYREKNTTILVHEDFEHNLEDCSAQNKGINSTEVYIENSNEGEPKDSCVLHSSVRHGFTPSKTDQTISDEFENSVIVELIDGDESTYKFGFEDRLSQGKASALKENIEIVNEKKENSSLLHTSDQDKITGFQVEVEQKDESEMSFNENNGESVGTPSKTSRDEASSLKVKKHSTQMSVSNEIKSLMMVDLDWTPSSNFRKVHIETVEDRNEVINENISAEDCQSPFRHEDNVVADMPGGSISLCENSEMEKPNSSQKIRNSGEKNKNQSFGYCYSTEPEESEGTENEFDTGFNTLNKENETQPFEATSPQTFSGFAEDHGFDTLNVENETQPFEATSPQITSGIAEHQVDLGLVPEFKDEDFIDEELLGPIEYKEEDTQIIGSFGDGFADYKCIETNILRNSLASDSKSAQTITPYNAQEMTSDEAENPAIVESTDGDEATYKFDVEGHLARDKENILRENFEIVNVENKDEDFIDEELLGPIEYKEEDTQIIGSFGDGFADYKCIETNILRNSLASDSKSAQTITPYNAQEMTSDEAENPAIVESTDGDEATYKFDVEGHLARDKENILRENFEIVNVENKESSLVDTADNNEITSIQVEAVQKDVDHISLEHNSAGIVRSPFVTSRDQPSNLKAQNNSNRAATPMSVSNEIQSLMMVDVDWTPTSEYQKVQTDSMPREVQTTSAFPAVEDRNKIITESISGEDCHSTLFSENFVDMSKSGEQGRNQSIGYDSSTEPEDSEGTENEFENETQPFSAASPQRTGFGKHQGNSSTNVDVSSTELRLLFDDETQRDVNSGSVAVSKDDDVFGPIEHRNEETQLIGIFDDDSFADTQCTESMDSPSALACKASASKSVQITNIAKESNEGEEEMASSPGFDDIFKEISSPEASNKLAGEIAFENVEKVNIADKDREDVPMGDRDGISHTLEEPTPVQTEKKHEDLVNAGIEMQGDETQYGDGMFDDLYGSEMEMVQEQVFTQKYDSSCYSGQFMAHEEAYVEEFGKTPTAKVVATVEIHSHTRNAIDNAPSVGESKEYTEYQNFSKLSQSSSPDPEFGIFQASLDSNNMFSSWEQNMFSEAKAKKPSPVGSKTPFIEEENTGFQLGVNDETEISAAFVTDETEICGSGQTETIAQCDAANIPDSVIEDEPLKYADEAVHDVAVVKKQNFKDVVQCTEYMEELTEIENLSQDTTPNSTEDADTVVSSSLDKGFAIDNVEEKSELVDVDERDEKCKPSSLKSTSQTSKIQKHSLIRGTPKKLKTNFDMKENAASIKREITGSVTVKSTAKRRALSEL